MNDAVRTARATRFDSRLMAVLLALGFLSVGSLMWLPVEAIVPPDVARKMPVMMLRAAASIQPAGLIAIGVILGCWAAPKLGLHAPVIEALLNRQPWRPALMRQWAPAVLVAIITMVIGLGYAQLTHGITDTAQIEAAHKGFHMPVITRLLYGGIGEELMTRWGLMTLFAWGLWRITGRRAPVQPWVIVMAAILAALLFGAGHLPIAFSLMNSGGAFLAIAVVAANALAGTLFGLLFWRRGLEAAMLAHALSHVFMLIAGHWMN